MSAIVVVLDLRGDQLDPATFDRVFRALDDRGPDGRGQWVQGPVGLGWQSLALTPRTRSETQPVVSGTRVAVFDGRLDNRAELFEALLGAPPEGHVVSDVELALGAHATWGAAWAEHLLGDFGAAVWDSTRTRSPALRDQLGVRPLYYWENGRTLVVSTEVRGVLAHPDVPREPNERHVAELLRGGPLSNGADTLYRGVVRLPPGHVLRASHRQVFAERYWEIDFDRSLVYGDSDDYVDHFMELFGDAVGCRLDGGDRVTVALSGGLDSSLVAAVASRRARRSGERPHVSATSLVFPGMTSDETEWSAGVVDALGMPGEQMPWEPMSRGELLEGAGRTGYLPPYPNSAYDMFVRGGLRRSVVLTGLGGDQWMNGQVAHFRDLIVARSYGALLHAIAQGSGREVARVVWMGLSARTIGRIRRATATDDPVWLGPALRNRSDDRAAPSPPRALGHLPLATVRRHGFLHEPLYVQHADVDEVYASRGHLVAAHPFYDRRLVEFVFAIPESQRWHGSDRRWLERRALRRVLPEHLSERTSKAKFAPLYVRQLGGLRLDEWLTDLHAEALGWVSASKLRDQLGGDLGDSTVGTLRALWAVVAVEAWLRAGMGAG